MTDPISRTPATTAEEQFLARVPAAIAPPLRFYRQLLAERRPGLVAGCYLTGSLALGAFDSRNSDVDFVAVMGEAALKDEMLKDEMLPHTAAILRDVHAQVNRRFPSAKMEGSYVRVEDLGRLPAAVSPALYCTESKLRGRGIHDLNPVTWWLLKQRSIALWGVEPQELPFAVAWEDVTAYMQDNLHTYWRGFTRPSSQLARLLTDEGVLWAVLGISRLWHALRVGAITSKVEAGEALLAECPQRWQVILQEALALRRGEPSRFRFRLRRAHEAAQFVAFAIRICSAEKNEAHVRQVCEDGVLDSQTPR